MSQTAIGSDHFWDGDMVFRGYFWHSLNANSVTVFRQTDDEWANWLRLRIRVASGSDYEARGNTPLMVTLLRWATGGEACGLACGVYVPLVSR